MTKKEKVIDGLIHCGVKECCGDCSYYDPEDDDREVVRCIKQLCRDALDLIQDTPVFAADNVVNFPHGSVRKGRW